jgi:hypothetical protein
MRSLAPLAPVSLLLMICELFCTDAELWAAYAPARPAVLVSGTSGARNLVSKHLYTVGQYVSYAENGIDGPWTGGYAIVALLPDGTDEPQYQISDPSHSYDRVVREHELAEDLQGSKSIEFLELR